MDIYRLSALEISEGIFRKDFCVREVLSSYINRIERLDNKHNEFCHIDFDMAMKKAKLIDERISKNDIKSAIMGSIVTVKDNICVKDMPTRAGSKALEGFVPKYNAHVVDCLERSGAIIIGKTNMDEFGMGSYTMNSYYGRAINPHSDFENNTLYSPGGSSGGAAIAAAACEATFSLATDTGGSIRLPASFCGINGIKPTYSSVSRYGLIEYASSLEQIGILSRYASDIPEILNIISEYDRRDMSTSFRKNSFDFKNIDLKKLKVAYILDESLEEDIYTGIEAALNKLKHMELDLKRIELPYKDYLVSIYYNIAMAEASSNLARYDGIRYGFSTEDNKSFTDIYFNSRAEGFGKEVKKRVLCGSYILGKGYYLKASRARALLIKEWKKIFNEYDIVLLPVFPVGVERFDKPVKEYSYDVYNVSANLLGIPAMSVYCGRDKSGLPIGLQLLSDKFSENKILKLADAYNEMYSDEIKELFKSLL